MADQATATLYAYVRLVPDPRAAKGKQYPWDFLLLVINAASVAGKRKLSEITDWVQAHGEEVCQAWGKPLPGLPSYATLRRTLVKVDVVQLEKHLEGYSVQLPAATAPDGSPSASAHPLSGLALDGKVLRGRLPYGAEAQVNVVSLVRHRTCYVVAQRRVTYQDERGAAAELLRGCDLRDTLITLDALFSQRALARPIREQGSDYLMIVKHNQPELFWAIDLLLQSPPLPPAEDDRQRMTTCHKGHGRIETRTLESSTLLKDYLDWPGVNQVLRRTCRRVKTKTGQISVEVTYGLTSAGRERASLQQLESAWRGHWTIEKGLHYVRDETMGEDRNQMHSGAAAHALAALRNGVLNTLRHAGWTNIAAAMRYFEASPLKAFALLGVGLS